MLGEGRAAGGGKTCQGLGIVRVRSGLSLGWHPDLVLRGCLNSLLGRAPWMINRLSPSACAPDEPGTPWRRRRGRRPIYKYTVTQLVLLVRELAVHV